WSRIAASSRISGAVPASMSCVGRAWKRSAGAYCTPRKPLAKATSMNVSELGKVRSSRRQTTCGPLQIKSGRTCLGAMSVSAPTASAAATIARRYASSSKSTVTTWRSRRSKRWRTRELFPRPKSRPRSPNTASRRKNLRLGRREKGADLDAGDSAHTRYRPAKGNAMGELTQVRVPDIGDFKDVPIIEIQVKPGDRVAAEAPLITLESDKASMEVPSP